MKPIERMKDILVQHRQEIARRFNVKEIGIFGSYVKNEQKKRSDIDILVEFREPVGFFEFMALEEYLEDIFGRKVDLVSKKALKPHIGKYILQEVVYI
jgi:predicted nucleotidyltransferase